MHAEDVEGFRGRWVAVVEGEDDRVVAAADSLEELQDALDAIEHPRVFARRIPARDGPIFIGIG